MTKKILIIDDSALMRRVLCDIINRDNRFEVKDTASNGQEGVELLKAGTYDAVVMDLVMPRMDGLTVLRELTKLRKRVKVLVFSSQTTEGAEITMEALELGAVDFVHKPASIFGAKQEDFAAEFLERLYEVCRSRVVYQPGTESFIPAGSEKPMAPASVTGAKPMARSASGNRIVAIASSTGGPKALQAVIPLLPGNLAAPVLIVQHMPAGFTASLAARLDSQSRLRVVEAAQDMEVCVGTVYIAPGGRHMHVVQKAGGHFIHLTDGPHREGVKPCANFMYESLSECGYSDIVCVVMTGMGADGTEGISNLKTVKDCYVITQDQSTCAVYGMPRSAVKRGLSDEVEPLENLASAITKHVGVK